MRLERFFFLNLKTLWHRIAYKGRKEERGLTNDEVKDTRCERLPQPRYPDHPSSLPRRRQSPHGPPWPGPCARTQTAFHQSRAGHLAGALDPALVGSTASTLIKSLIFWGEGRGKKGGGGGRGDEKYVFRTIEPCQNANNKRTKIKGWAYLLQVLCRPVHDAIPH